MVNEWICELIYKSMVLIIENTKSNLKNLRRKMYELRIENKKFSRVPQIKSTYMINFIETSIVFAFPVYYSRISMASFVLELCSAFEVEIGLQVVSPTKETYIYLYRKYFTKAKMRTTFIFLFVVPFDKKKIVFYSDVIGRRLSVHSSIFVEFATSFRVNDTRTIQPLD